MSRRVRGPSGARTPRGGEPGPTPAAFDAETLFDLSLDMLCIAGTDGRFKKVNPAFERILGWSHDQLLAHPFYDLVHPDDLEATQREVGMLAQGIPTISFENRYQCAGGEYKSLLWTAQPDVGAGLIYAVAHDVTRRRERDRELNEAKDQAEAAARAKADFLAVMSHEIRTPMSGIIGMAELALEAVTDERLRDQIQVIRQSAESLLYLMHDVLDISKAEAGRLELVAAPFSLSATLGDAIKIFAVEAGRKGLDLMLWIDPAVPDLLVGDAPRLRQVIINLVGNALKFTAQGEIAVEVEAESGTGSDVEAGSEIVLLRVRVRDTGIGIPEDKRQAIFDSYTQADGSTQHRFGGTGLGLAICARLIELMGGKIWVESEVGAGSVFQFTLPVLSGAPATGGASASGTAPAPGPVDEASKGSGRSVLRQTLEDWGVRVVEVESGAAARGKVGSRARGARRGGADGAAATDRESLRILLAEDSVVNQRVTAGLLETLGHRVDVAANGSEAVAAAARRRYDLVLMDLEMPLLGGLDATLAIRRRESTTGGHLPIVALTARAMEEDRARCLAAGMDGYLAKPLRRAELLALAAGLAAGRRSIERAASPYPPESRPAGAAVAPPAAKGAAVRPLPEGGPVDWQAALEGVGGDEGLLARVVDAALEEGPALIEELRRRGAEGDAEGVRRAAHKLEGTLRCIRDPGLVAMAEDLEARARRAELVGIAETIEGLAARIGAILAAFQAWRSGGRI